MMQISADQNEDGTVPALTHDKATSVAIHLYEAVIGGNVIFAVVAVAELSLSNLVQPAL